MFPYSHGLFARFLRIDSIDLSESSLYPLIQESDNIQSLTAIKYSFWGYLKNSVEIAIASSPHFNVSTIFETVRNFSAKSSQTVIFMSEIFFLYFSSCKSHSNAGTYQQSSVIAYSYVLLCGEIQ